MFTRLTQRVKEKTGRAAATRYAQEFEEQLRLLDAMKEHTRRIVSHTESVLEASCKGGNYSQAGTTDGLGELCRQYADYLPQDEQYAKTLKWLAAVCKKTDAAERKHAKDSADHMCLPLNEWIRGECALMQRDRDQLEKRRLEMDAANTKLAELLNSSHANEPATKSDMKTSQRDDVSEASTKSGKGAGAAKTKREALEQRAERKRQQHEELLQKVQGQADRLDQHMNHHRQCVFFFVRSQGILAKHIETSINERIDK